MDVSKLKGREFTNEDERTKALEELYADDIKEYVRQCGSSTQFVFHEDDQLKFLEESIEPAAEPEDAFFQDLWAARHIYRSNIKHVHDIGSRFDGLIAHLLAMEVRVTMLDIRPFDRHIEGIDYIQTDAMDMSNIPDNSIETLTAICSLEHFGLGRYSDPIDYDGWKKALRAIRHKMKIGGKFYMSVPVGDERVRFHAYRVFHPMTIVNELLPDMVLDEFSYIDSENTRIETCLKGHETAGTDLQRQLDYITENFIGHVRTGLFAFRKIAPLYQTDEETGNHDLL